MSNDRQQTFLLYDTVYFSLYETMYNNNIYFSLYKRVYKSKKYFLHTRQCISCHTRRCIITIFTFHYIREYIRARNISIIQDNVFLIIQDDV